ncbi:MAG: hypothetical protein ACI8SK_000746, partial [Shewanella sp.]
TSLPKGKSSTVSGLDNRYSVAVSTSIIHTHH